MRDETGTGLHTLDNSSETFEIGLTQQPEMDTQVTEASVEELTLEPHQTSIKRIKRIKQATYLIFRQVEDLWALLVGRTEMQSAGNSEASGSRRNNESSVAKVSKSLCLQKININPWNYE